MDANFKDPPVNRLYFYFHAVARAAFWLILWLAGCSDQPHSDDPGLCEITWSASDDTLTYDVNVSCVRPESFSLVISDDSGIITVTNSYLTCTEPLTLSGTAIIGPRPNLRIDGYLGPIGQDQCFKTRTARDE